MTQLRPVAGGWRLARCSQLAQTEQTTTWRPEAVFGAIRRKSHLYYEIWIDLIYIEP